jgi:hypothetical protein
MMIMHPYLMVILRQTYRLSSRSQNSRIYRLLKAIDTRLRLP